MANTLKLYISPESQRLLANPGAYNSAPTPVFYSGNKLNLELHLYEGAGVARSPYEVPFPAGSTVKVAIGSVSGVPTSGQWRLSVSSTETADLAYNATPSQVQTALNALSAVSTAGGVTVAALGGGYSITWNTVGTKPTILAGSDTLAPASYESILILQAGGVSTREIVFVELVESPVALAETFSPVGTPVVTATTVSAWNGDNKVVRVGISPNASGGSYVLTFGGKSAVVSANAGSTDVRTSLIAAGIADFSSVSQSGQQQFDIIFTADSAYSVDGSGLIASMGIVGEIDLATAELIAYLGSEASKSATIEVTVESAGETRTICQVECLVASGVLSTGAVAPISVGTLLTEAVANNRFVRRDAAQSPSSADLDIIWPNLGVTTDGSDTAAAISNASAPASGNPFLTVSAGNAAYSPLFDQSLNIGDAVNFSQVTISNSGLGNNIIFTGSLMELNGGGITFPDATVQTTAFIPADYLAKAGNLSGLASASTARTNLGLGTMATEAATDYLTKAGNLSGLASAATARTNLGLGTMAVETASNYLDKAGNLSGLASASTARTNLGLGSGNSPTFTKVTAEYSTGGLYPLTIDDSVGITFPDATVQNTRVVQDTQANGSGFSTGGFNTTHYPNEVKVVDDTGTTYWVPARLV